MASLDRVKVLVLGDSGWYPINLCLTNRIVFCKFCVFRHGLVKYNAYLKH